MANDMKQIQIAAILTLGALAPVSLACTIPPNGFGDETPLYTLDKAEAIILAEWECESKSCEFSVVEVLLGEEESVENTRIWYRQAMRAREQGRIEEAEDFSAHRDGRFWRGEIGRSNHFPGMCVPSFTFIEGESYLLITDRPASAWSAELIQSSDDAWLEYVREFVDAEQSP